MEKENIIYITNKFGKEEKMQVLFTYKNNKTLIDYIVYQDKNGEIYAAKYDSNKTLSNLDTNLSQQELDILEKILKEKNTSNK